MLGNVTGNLKKARSFSASIKAVRKKDEGIGIHTRS